MNEVPQHVAIIMDGNGRWAQEKNLPRIEGHKAGLETVRTIVRASREIGVRYLSLYAFSSENWKRPRTEIFSLMNLMKRFLIDEIDEMNKNGIRLLAIGRLSGLPKGVQKKLQQAMKATEMNDRMSLILALNYGSRIEILDAVSRIITEYGQTGIKDEKLTEELFSEYLYTKDLPDPDMLIRTSGEQRLSNFLLWQLSYAEFWFTQTPWPEFGRDEYVRTLEEFKSRNRRYGGVQK